MRSKHLIALILTFLLTAILAEGGTDRYSRIRIFVPDRTLLGRIWATGVDFEGSSGKPGGWMEFVAGKAELDGLRTSGIDYTVITEDLSAAYEKSLAEGQRGTLGFGYGSMGGYLTND